MTPKIANTMHELANAVYSRPGRGRHRLIVRRFERLQYAMAALYEPKRPHRTRRTVQMGLFEGRYPMTDDR